MNGFSLGMPEFTIVLMFAAFGVVPWVAGIWALVTLNRIKHKVDSIERKLAGSQ